MNCMWMSSVAMIIVLAASDLCAASDRMKFKPMPVIGGHWKVEVRRWTEPPSLPPAMLTNWTPTITAFVYQFSVEALENVDSERCVRIRIDPLTFEGQPIQKPVNYWRIYLRDVDFTLKKVERLSAQTGHLQRKKVFGGGPVDATDCVDDLPMAVPSFDEEQHDAPPVKVLSDGVRRINSPYFSKQAEVRMQVRVDDKETEVLSMTLEKDSGADNSRLAKLTWIKGAPWWTEAIYYRKGRQWCTAKLIK